MAKMWRGLQVFLTDPRVPLDSNSVERSLRELLSEREPFDYATIRERAIPAKPPVPELTTPAVPDLRVFDALLAEGIR